MIDPSWSWRIDLNFHMKDGLTLCCIVSPLLLEGSQSTHLSCTPTKLQDQLGLNILLSLRACEHQGNLDWEDRSARLQENGASYEAAVSNVSPDRTCPSLYSASLLHTAAETECRRIDCSVLVLGSIFRPCTRAQRRLHFLLHRGKASGGDA
jgi:hypothetical protein